MVNNIMVKEQIFLFWNDKYEAWNWKNKDTYVGTYLKHPLLQSPGITLKLVEYKINKRNERVSMCLHMTC